MHLADSVQCIPDILSLRVSHGNQTHVFGIASVVLYLLHKHASALINSTTQTNAYLVFIY